MKRTRIGGKVGEKAQQEPVLDPLPPLGESEIRLTLVGGMVQGMVRGKNVPENIIVTVKDYDVEGMTPDEMKRECVKDEYGEICIYREEFSDE